MRTRGQALQRAVPGPSLTDAQRYDDDIIETSVLLSPSLEPEDPLVGREIQLKFRCRTEIHRISVVSVGHCVMWPGL